MDGKRNVAAAFYWASNFARMVNGLGRAKMFGATCLTQQSWPLPGRSFRRRAWKVTGQF